MYENITYETILKRLIDKIPKTFDKREGSIIYDALAPCAIELQLMYIELDVILKETFGDSASREYLIRRALERGIIPYKASYAILKGEFDIDIPIGSRFSQGELNYIAVEKIETCIYKMKCETIGTSGNKNFGVLIPIEYIKDLKKAELTELLIPAEDAEDTEKFRTRYLNSFNVKAYGGNIHDYIEKTTAISGVGDVKVTPVWQGGGTVKLTILDSEYNKATDTLIESVQSIMDPTKDEKGIGIAPIGHIVTVDTVTEVPININTKITFVKVHNFDTTKSEIFEAIDEYFLSLRKKWASSDNLYIRIAQIETRIMNIDGVIDIENTTINGNTSNLVMDKYETPIRGDFIHE